MGIIDQLLQSSQAVGPDGLVYTRAGSAGGSSGEENSFTGVGVFDPNGPMTPGSAYPIFGADGGMSAGQFGAGGDINFEDFLQGAVFVGGAATGMAGAFGGLGAAEAGGGSMDFTDLFSSFGDSGLSSDIGSLGSDFGGAGIDGLDLGDGMTAGDFSFGSDSGGLMSSLGNSLGGSTLTGFSKLLPLLGQLLGGQAARRSGNTANSLAQELLKRSDPFAPYRQGYADKLQQLESTHDITSIPGYQAGLTAVQRAGAAQGFTGSGNMMKALEDFGGNFFDKEASRLAGLAGAGATPGAGFGTAAGLIGQGQASGAFGQQQIINALAGVLGPGNPVSDFMSNLGSPALAGNPMQIGGTSPDQVAG